MVAFGGSVEMLHYEGLSYVWGDLQEWRLIQVNGCPFQVTLNLENAQRYLRLCSLTRVLWIDAICINQRDENEKAHQVRRMRQNYSNATRVLVWLGEASDDLGPDQELTNAMSFLAGSSLDNQAESVPFKTGVKKLLQKPWWSRMWVVQEVFAAEQPPLVGFKDMWIEWDMIEKMIQNLNRALKDDQLMDMPSNA